MTSGQTRAGRAWRRRGVEWAEAVLRSLPMGTMLTKRRAVDLCRVATCLCRSA